MGEKTRRTLLIREDNRPPPQEEVEMPQSQQEEEGDVVEIVTTTGDHDVVDEGHFTSESAQILIGEIMRCNRDLKTSSKTSMMGDTTPSAERNVKHSL
ncbi:hypothetical protein AB205_0145990 [Aquarana catesbeiana]|uniref:Uncharacterized protein n=1 Tax=Aquarana catesbeiana TaxID=8400 RepID=A0A2G9R9S3_AQUCT|nr:hypothetical protein AB205_0145990 [Aquarana catesbeiana]